MKCHMPGPNVKILARAIHAMSRIGDELYVESEEDSLVLRALSPAESAYCHILLRESFFSYFQRNPQHQRLKCKVAMKSALAVFKSPGHIDKLVEQLEIRLIPEDSQLLFQLKCKQGVVKTHYISILNCEQMEAFYCTDMVPNRLMTQHKVLSEAINNFQINEDQVTIEVNPQVFYLRNYINDKDTSRVTRTQLSLKPAEFDTYSIGVDTDITFSLKELRAVLAFAENLNLPISLHFETAGKPAIFAVTNNNTFEANFVMATERPDSQDTCTTAEPETTKKANTSKKRSKTFDDNVSRAKRPHLDETEKNANALDEDSHLFDLVDITVQEALNETTNNNKTKSYKSLNNKQFETNCDKKQSNCVDNELEDDFQIPGSPILNTQVTRLRTVFRRCFDATIDPRALGPKAILAEDSDGEDE